MPSGPGARGGAGAAALRFLVISLMAWTGIRLAFMEPAAKPVKATLAAMDTAPAPSTPGAAARFPIKVAPPGALAQPEAIAPPAAPRIAGLHPVFAGNQRGAEKMLIADNGAGTAPPTDPLRTPIGGGAALAVGSALATPAAAEAAPPTAAAPFWMQRQLAGWSGDAWLYLRSGGGAAARDLLAPGQVGGGQAGARLSYGFGRTGRWRGQARANIAVARPQQREIAVGVTVAPMLRLPVDLAVERRIAVGSEGRDAFAAMLVGGVGDVALPADFRLDAYAQAGIVGAKRHDLFADGAVVVDRRLGSGRRASVHLGAVAAAAAQTGAARVDVGPRVSVRLPEVAGGSRIALDWRHRITGNAKPGDGLALTIATHF